MNVIVCVDDDMGMLFNHRRQSRDRKVVDIIADMTKTSTLWISDFSRDLFQEFPNKIIVSDDFLNRADSEDYCFVEDCPLCEYRERIDQLYLFGWNKKYPSDWKLDLDLNNYNMKRTEEFTGYSHGKITLSVYIKQNKTKK